MRFKAGNIGLLEINLNWTALLRKPIKVTLIGVTVELEYQERNNNEAQQEPINVKDEISKIEQNIESQAGTSTNPDQNDNGKSMPLLIISYRIAPATHHRQCAG